MSGQEPLILHDYWRSTASYRVRIALNLKGLAYTAAPHDLRIGEQRADAYAALNPQRLVPALETPAGPIAQSLAILEYLEERHPTPPLLPRDPEARAIIRQMAMIVACDIHPLNNLRVLTRLRETLGADEAQVQDWLTHWMREGFTALEALIARHGGKFACGDTITLADCCIVPQLYAATRFGVGIEDFPRLAAVGARAAALEPVLRAHPDRQENYAKNVRTEGDH